MVSFLTVESHGAGLFPLFRTSGIFKKRRYGCKLVLSFLFLLSCGTVVSCAPTFSKQLRNRALPPIPFQELLERGEAHRGEVVILGGYVLKAVNEQDGSLLTILQAPLDSQDRPKSRDLSEGRFLIRTKRFLDPEIYSKGRKLSVGGIVSGVRSQPLGKHLYPYPVIEAEELHLWPKETRYVRPYHDYWHYPWYPYPYRPYPWWFW